MSKAANKQAAKHCVIWYEHREETPLDVLEGFVNWTKILKKMNGNVEIYIMNSVKFQLERKVSKG